jgi:hypothetical protein
LGGAEAWQWLVPLLAVCRGETAEWTAAHGGPVVDPAATAVVKDAPQTLSKEWQCLHRLQAGPESNSKGEHGREA